MPLKRVSFVVLVLTCLIGCGRGADDLSPTQIARSQIDTQTRGYLVEAQRAIEQKDLSKALAFSDSAVQAAPELTDAHFIRGRALSAARQYDAAEAAYKQTIALDPAYRVANLHLGNLAFSADRFQDALTHYLNTINATSLSDVTASSLIEKGDDPETTGALMQIARTLTKLGNFGDARRAYELALTVDSTNASVHSDFGVMLRDDGDIDGAIEHARKAVALAPTNVEYGYFLGALLVRQGSYEEAIPILEAVIAVRPWQQGAHFNLGQALVRTGQSEAGKYMLAVADTVQLLQTEIDQQKANVQMDPNLPANWVALGKTYLKARRYADAEESFQYILQFLPEHEDALYNLALTHHQQGDVVRARYVLRSLLRINPDHAAGKVLLDSLA